MEVEATERCYRRLGYRIVLESTSTLEFLELSRGEANGPR